MVSDPLQHVCMCAAKSPDRLAGGTLVVGTPAADSPAGGIPETVDTLAVDILDCTVDHHNTLGSRNSLGSDCGDDGRSCRAKAASMLSLFGNTSETVAYDLSSSQGCVWDGRCSNAVGRRKGS